MKFSLLSDGSSDRALVPIIQWTLRDGGFHGIVKPEWAELRRLRRPPRILRDRIRVTLDLYPCDILFIHRDAEAMTHGDRKAEIHRELESLRAEVDIPACISVVPVRMMEAWLLHDESAIRLAAGNPNGDTALGLPRFQDIEDESDPKVILHRAIHQAAELPTRRRRTLRPGEIVHRIGELIQDFSPLKNLHAFTEFSSDVSRVLRDNEFV